MRKAEQNRPYPPDFVSASTLAYRLDLSLRIVQDYVRAGFLPPAVMVGNERRWSWADVLTHIIAQNGLAPADAGDKGPVDEYTADIRRALEGTQKAANDRAA